MTASLPVRRSEPLRLKEMLPHEIALTLSRDSRLIVPVGTCEYHGPHLPAGIDTIIAERFAEDFSSRFGVLLAPAIEYGVNPDDERTQPGSGSMRRKTLHRLLNDLLYTWECGGVTEFILLTTHAYDPHQEALATVVTVRARVRVVDLLGMSMDDLLEGQTQAMHGDEVDTSLLLHLAPHLVRMDLAQDFMMSRERLRRYRRGWQRVPAESAGSIGRPTLASARKGEAIYERVFTRVAERIFGANPAAAQA
ncbi:MAG TPA: creatininase family protein [Gemmatimonadales bacterium]|nr:creatininase family protein [Gemmatimonadales bacterium]